MDEISLLLTIREVLDSSTSVLNSDLSQDILEALKKSDLFIHSGRVCSIVEVAMRDCGPDYDAYLVYTDYEPEDEEE